MADVSAEETRAKGSRDAILPATANLPACSTNWTAVQATMRDFQTELRKILVSLIEMAQKLLALNPDAVELRRQMLCWMRLPCSSSQKWACLRAEPQKALLLSHMSVPQAMEWLIEYSEDPAIDEPLPGHTTQAGPSAAATTSTSTSTSTSSEAAVGTSVEDNLQEDAQAVISLMEMGFDEKVTDALRVNNNQQNAACEWPLEDRKPSPEKLDQGIDPNSPLSGHPGQPSGAAGFDKP